MIKLGFQYRDQRKKENLGFNTERRKKAVRFWSTIDTKYQPLISNNHMNLSPTFSVDVLSIIASVVLSFNTPLDKHCSPPPPLDTPRQREFVCWACTGTAQVGASLAVSLDSLFKRPRSSLCTWQHDHEIVSLSVSLLALGHHAVGCYVQWKGGHLVCWSRIARGCRSAHKYCRLFWPTSRFTIRSRWVADRDSLLDPTRLN